jgi:hypothetical protein
VVGGHLLDTAVFMIHTLSELDVITAQLVEDGLNLRWMWPIARLRGDMLVFPACAVASKRILLLARVVRPVAVSIVVVVFFPEALRGKVADEQQNLTVARILKK